MLTVQALRLSSEVYGGYVKVEEYSHGHHIKVVYWRPGSDQLLSAFLLDNSESKSHNCSYQLVNLSKSRRPLLVRVYMHAVYNVHVHSGISLPILDNICGS